MFNLELLLNLKDENVQVQISDTNEVQVQYCGKLSVVNEDTERFVLVPKTILTNIKGKVYEAPYSQNGGPYDIGFDFDSINDVYDNTIEVNF